MAIQIEDLVGLDPADALLASAKAGIGTTEILDAIVTRLPSPTGDPNAPLKALIFDSWYDAYRGVIMLIRVLDGVVRPRTKIRLMAAKHDYEVEQVGIFSPKPEEVQELSSGEVGFVVANIKHEGDAWIGDTVTCLLYTSDAAAE